MPVSGDGKSGGELRICAEEDIDGHRNIYQCPVAWKGRNANSNDTDSVGYEDLVASTPSSSASSTATSTPSQSATSTPVSTSQSTTSATSTPVSQPTRPASTPATQPITSPTSAPVRAPVTSAINNPVTVQPINNAVEGELEEDDDDDEEKEEEDDDDDEEDDDDDDRVLGRVKRDQNLKGIARLWRRNIPVISVLETNPESSGAGQNAFSNAAVVGVMLPQMINATTGRAGVLLSEQCVQMILWPNQMYVFF